MWKNITINGTDCFGNVRIEEDNAYSITQSVHVICIHSSSLYTFIE